MNPKDVAADLSRRGCRLYHAINLPDLRTYVEHSALLSRGQLALTQSGIGTPFASDTSDEERGLLDRCFGNLADFGARFWRYETATPNAYGPITLVFSPAVFHITVDAAVTKVNAGSPNFDLTTCRVASREAWTRLFADGTTSALGPGCFFSEFSTSTNTLPFSLLERIIVEPITFDDVELLEAVRSIAGDFAELVEERSTSPLTHKRRILNGLAQWCADRGGTPPRSTDDDALPDVVTWYRTATPQAAVYRWFQYLVTTLREMSPDEVAAPAPPPPRCETCMDPAYYHCTGCDRWLCKSDYYGAPGSDDEHDARAQRRCYECCFDPT